MKKTIIKTFFSALLLVIAVFSIASCTPDENGGDHVHDFQQKWDETHHFEECSCGKITDRVEHTLEWVIDSEPTYTDGGIKHQECSACGYKTIEVLKNDSELVITLIEYLNWLDSKISYDLPDSTLENKINSIKSGRIQPLLVDFKPDNCYFVCGYHSCDEDLSDKEDYYCASKYTWVKYESEKDIKDSYDDKAFIVAFQINRPSLTKNILTGDKKSQSVETIGLYKPKFVSGTNVSTFKVVDSTYIHLTASESDIVYLSSYEPNYLNEIPCVRLDDRYYIALEIYTVGVDGKRHDYDNSWNFGEYYNSVMEIMITGKYSQAITSVSTRHYGLLDIDEFVEKIVRE
ncbi:MAG: hypothetical protein IJW93_05750 [Clostridia bacterium]|nr:hypothetical protein [Clostridia bacterium]